MRDDRALVDAVYLWFCLGKSILAIARKYRLSARQVEQLIRLGYQQNRRHR